MNQQKALEKIRKCLALSKSSNANEAAAALRQAQALMARYGIADETVALSDIETDDRPAGTAKNPPQYQQMLVTLMKRAFGVEALYVVDWYQTRVRFIGVESQAMIAGYAYDVLYRQLKKDRAVFLKTLRRYKKGNKTRKADIFAQHWVMAVWGKVEAFDQKEEVNTLIRQYMKTKYDNVDQSKPRKHKARSGDEDAMYYGYQAGQKASLHRGMTGEDRKRLEVEA